LDAVGSCVFQRSKTLETNSSWTVFQRDHGRLRMRVSDGLNVNRIVHDQFETVIVAGMALPSCPRWRVGVARDERTAAAVGKAC
jgi:hypothetical protein